MRNFQDTFETRKRSFISAFAICMTVILIKADRKFYKLYKTIAPESNIALFTFLKLIYVEND